MKLPIELLQAAESEFPKTTAEISTIRATHASTPALNLDGLAHFELRRSMIAMSAREDFDPAFERYLGTNDLLSVNYLLTGFMRSRSVGRIKYFDRVKHKTAYATGFMVTPDLMMTNHHVFPVANAAEFASFANDAAIEFGYEFDLQGKRGEPVVHALDPETFLHTSKAYDLALVAVRQTDVTGTQRLRDQGYLILNGKIGKAGTADFATIIQHADGEEKQVALRNNEILDNDLTDVLIYKSDTAPGSSGAPVFNNEWQVIALHSAGVAKKDAQNNYLDKHDQIIPIENGQIEEARIVWLSNRGIRVSAILAYLRSSASTVALHPLINVFNSPSYTDSRPLTTSPVPKVQDELVVKPAEGAPAAPAVAPAPIGAIEIRVSISGGQAFSQTFASPAQVAPHLMLVEAEKKLDDEQDYSTCMGFEDEFMGIRIPMPLPSEKLRKKLARLRDTPASMVLKYHHYSTMQHAVRRVPAISAINVHGKYRYEALGSETREDNWLRDNRLDYDAQLDDKWYAKSGFDRGHLSRREDAEWGTSMQSAKIAADLTCSYTNAVPQVPAFNRAIMGHHGQWGRLEQNLLEQGVEDEPSKSARICVFSGPLFLEDDPVYASVQVALSCFKVVVWCDKSGALRTTAFRLSQEKLVGNIEFEALHFDKLFKLQQKPIGWIEKATGFSFSKVMHDSDTYAGASDSVDEAALERLVVGPR